MADTPVVIKQASLYLEATKALVPNMVNFANDFNRKLVEIKFTGAVNTTFTGVSTFNTGWFDDVDASTELGLDTTSQWLGHLYKVPAMQHSKTPEGELFTTAPTTNFFGNSNKTISDYNMAAAKVATSINENEMFPEVIKCVYRDSQFKVLAGDTVMYGKIPLSAEPMLRSYAGTFGYRLDNNAMLLVHGTGSGLTFEQWNPTYDAVLKAFKSGNVINVAANSAATYAFTRFDELTPRGTKYLICMVTSFDGVGVGQFGDSSSVSGFKDNPIKSGSGYVLIGVPVIDDGRAEVPFHWVNGMTGAEYMIKKNDIRYTPARDRLAALPSIDKLRAVYGDVLPDGTPTNDLQVSGYAGATFGRGNRYLLLMAPPIPKHHLLCNKMVIEESKVKFADESIADLVTITAQVSMMCMLLTKDWYVDYYTTGFGLYKPRESTVQRKILDAWRALEFNEFGICVDPAFATLDPGIVDRTDLARRYKKARKQACKEDDWDQQKYSANMTYGQLKAKMSSMGRVKGFYCTDRITAEPEFQLVRLSGVTWSKVGTGATPYQRKEGTVIETYGINNTTRDLICVELSAGANGLTTLAPLLQSDFGLTIDEVEALSMAAAESNSGYLYQRPELVGYVMAEQYFSPARALANSGYPVFRYISDPYRTHMVMRSVADLSRFGDPLLEIYNSLTADAVVAKLKQLVPNKPKE